MNHTLQRGFTLIEMMVIVAIVGVLAALAMPVYRDHTIRARVSEGLVLANMAKTALAVTLSTTGAGSVAAYPGTGAAPAARPNLSSYDYAFSGSSNVVSIAVSGIPAVATPEIGDGRITITYTGQAGAALGAPVILTPGSGSVNNSALPSDPMHPSRIIVWGCGIANEAALKYLPAHCRYVVP